MITQTKCNLCGEMFDKQSSQSVTHCKKCLDNNSTKVCEECGKEYHRTRNRSLHNFMNRRFCDSEECQTSGARCKGIKSEALTAIFASLITGDIVLGRKTPPADILEEVIAENCAYFRLYQLYDMLDEYNDGMKLEDRLPNTQIYLLDILRRIRNLNELLRIDPKRKMVGYYADGRAGGNWNTGPMEWELTNINE